MELRKMQDTAYDFTVICEFSNMMLTIGGSREFLYLLDFLPFEWADPSKAAWEFHRFLTKLP